MDRLLIRLPLARRIERADPDEIDTVAEALQDVEHGRAQLNVTIRGLSSLPARLVCRV